MVAGAEETIPSAGVGMVPAPDHGWVKGRLRSGKECPGSEEPTLLNLHLWKYGPKPGHVPRARRGDVEWGLGFSSHCRKQTRT